MATLSQSELKSLLAPYAEVSDPVLEQLSIYLDLLLKWNARTNLTAIREPREIVQRHFGESLFAARLVPECRTLLDFGSGAGFPGVPIQLSRPELQVTLAESQNKKASFLREAVRVLGLTTEVWSARVESMPPERLFGVVALRAVDNPTLALEQARQRLAPGGTIVHLTGASEESAAQRYPIPGTTSSFVELSS